MRITEMNEEMANLADESQRLLETIAPNVWVEATIVIIVSLIFAKLADLFIVGTVAKLLAKTENTLDDRVLQLLHKPLFTTFSVLGLIVASYMVADELGDQILAVNIAFLKTIIIISWLGFLMRSTGAVLGSMERNPVHFKFAQKDTVPLMRNMAMVFLVLAGAYAILVSWDINVTGLVASAGIVGLALSFAAQDTLSHLFAGVAILADRPYRIGDYIVLDTGERGEVTAIGLRSTRLLTRDDVEISIPNGVMGSAKIVNESGGASTRYRIGASVGVAYGSDVNHVLQVLEQIGVNSEGLCSDPAPRVRFRAFGASSLDFELLAWISEPSLRGLRMHEMNCEIYRRFMEEKIIIPFPQQDVWIRELPSGGNDEQARPE
ncbi:MAG: mechanosensitive ion channel family protein [Gammaproteobacteria bacterium]|nr:MAG: mechanosensitive ion channel family protein [Gammaproteobacteria bacterium]